MNATPGVDFAHTAQAQRQRQLRRRDRPRGRSSHRRIGAMGSPRRGMLRNAGKGETVGKLDLGRSTSDSSEATGSRRPTGSDSPVASTTPLEEPSYLTTHGRRRTEEDSGRDDGGGAAPDRRGARDGQLSGRLARAAATDSGVIMKWSISRPGVTSIVRTKIEPSFSVNGRAEGWDVALSP